MTFPNAAQGFASDLSLQSIRLSMMNFQRVVILREKDADRYLPIWIGAAEADGGTDGQRLAELEAVGPLLGEDVGEEEPPGDDPEPIVHAHGVRPGRRACSIRMSKRMIVGHGVRGVGSRARRRIRRRFLPSSGTCPGLTSLAGEWSLRPGPATPP